MSDDSSDSSDESEDQPTPSASSYGAYPMMMSYGYAYPSAYSYAAYGSYPGFGGYAGYAAGSPEYAAYMQQMTAGCGGAGGAAGAGAGAMGTPGAMGAPGAGAPGAPGIATDPLAAYYGAAGYAAQSLHYGTVKTFLAEKGFGFIECATSENGGDVFFSKSELPLDLESDSHKDLKGKPVQFEITVGKDGRDRAANVQLCSMELVERAGGGKKAVGAVKSFNERHGFGFLTLEDGERDARFQAADLAPELAALGAAMVGRAVKCQIQQMGDGKVKAINVAPLPGGAWKGKGKGKGKGPGPRVTGVVKSFDPETRLGILECPGKADEVHFFDTKNLLLEEGSEVSLALRFLPDGICQGTDLTIGNADPLAVEPVVLKDGATITATVKSFNDTRGFGFLKIPGAGMDLYFHGRDLDEPSQGVLMLVGGNGLSGCLACCRVEARSDGRWNARNVNLLESGGLMLDGIKLAGMIRCFYENKGFGFLNVTGNPIDIYFQGRDVGPDAQKRCEEHGAVGSVVWCTAYAQSENRWQAREIVLAGDGTSPGGLTPDMLGAKGWGRGDDEYGWDGWDGWEPDYSKGKGKGGSLPKVEKQIIPGCQLVGRIKSYNAERSFGFISVEGQTADVYFQIWDLIEELKSQVDAHGPESLVPGAAVSFWLQLMPGGGRLRARDVALADNPVSEPAAVEAAVLKAAAVANEAIIPGTGSVLYDGAEVSGKVRTFNQEREASASSTWTGTRWTFTSTQRTCSRRPSRRCRGAWIWWVKEFGSGRRCWITEWAADGAAMTSASPSGARMRLLRKEQGRKG
ncbi:unnamed protein product [Effrenium voratum]|nr:unnamed protein product [Effrenium voratum]